MRLLPLAALGAALLWAAGCRSPEGPRTPETGATPDSLLRCERIADGVSDETFDRWVRVRHHPPPGSPAVPPPLAREAGAEVGLYRVHYVDDNDPWTESYGAGYWATLRLLPDHRFHTESGYAGVVDITPFPPLTEQGHYRVRRDTLTLHFSTPPDTTEVQAGMPTDGAAGHMSHLVFRSAGGFVFLVPVGRLAAFEAAARAGGGLPEVVEREPWTEGRAYSSAYLLRTDGEPTCFPGLPRPQPSLTRLRVDLPEWY